MNARDAIIHADANLAVKTIIGRMSKGRCRIFFPMGSSVQIAHRRRRIGDFRVVAHLNSNIALGKGGYLPKWPKYKTRLIEESADSPMGDVLFPKKPGKQSRTEKARGSAQPTGGTIRKSYNKVSSPDEESVARNVRLGEFGPVRKDIEEIIESGEAWKQAIFDRTVSQSPNRIGFATACRPISVPSYPSGFPKSCDAHTIRKAIQAIQPTEMIPNACYP